MEALDESPEGTASDALVALLTNIADVLLHAQTAFTHTGGPDDPRTLRVALEASRAGRRALRQGIQRSIAEAQDNPKSAPTVGELMLAHQLWHLTEATAFSESFSIGPFLAFLRSDLLPQTSPLSDLNVLLSHSVALLQTPNASVDQEVAASVWDAALKLVIEGRPKDAAKLLTVLASVRRDASTARLAALVGSCPLSPHVHVSGGDAPAGGEATGGAALEAWAAGAEALLGELRAGGVWDPRSGEAEAGGHLLQLMVRPQEAASVLDSIELRGPLLLAGVDLASLSPAAQEEALRPYRGWAYCALVQLTYARSPAAGLSQRAVAEVASQAMGACGSAAADGEGAAAVGDSAALCRAFCALLEGNAAAGLQHLLSERPSATWASAPLADLLWHAGQLRAPPQRLLGPWRAPLRPHLLLSLAVDLAKAAPADSPGRGALLRQAALVAASASPAAVTSPAAVRSRLRFMRAHGGAGEAAGAAAVLEELAALSGSCEAAQALAEALALRTGRPPAAGDAGGERELLASLATARRVGAGPAVARALVDRFISGCLGASAPGACPAGARLASAFSWALRDTAATAAAAASSSAGADGTDSSPAAASAGDQLSRVTLGCADLLLLPALSQATGLLQGGDGAGPSELVGRGLALGRVRASLRPLDDELRFLGLDACYRSVREAERAVVQAAAAQGARAGGAGAPDAELELRTASPLLLSTIPPLLQVAVGANAGLRLLLAVRRLLELLLVAAEAALVAAEAESDGGAEVEIPGASAALSSGSTSGSRALQAGHAHASSLCLCAAGDLLALLAAAGTSASAGTGLAEPAEGDAAASGVVTRGEGLPTDASASPGAGAAGTTVDVSAAGAFLFPADGTSAVDAVRCAAFRTALSALAIPASAAGVPSASGRVFSNLFAAPAPLAQSSAGQHAGSGASRALSQAAVFATLEGALDADAFA